VTAAQSGQNDPGCDRSCKTINVVAVPATTAPVTIQNQPRL
jgi:hypothetical protein